MNKTTRRLAYKKWENLLDIIIDVRHKMLEPCLYCLDADQGCGKCEVKNLCEGEDSLHEHAIIHVRCLEDLIEDLITEMKKNARYTKKHRKEAMKK